MNPKAGCAGSVLDMLHEEGFNHQVQTDINVCREECSGMLSQFFKDLRKNGQKNKSHRRRGILMKRSEINAALKEMEQMVQKYRFAASSILQFYTGRVGKERS